jgi:pilus assembly protein HofO
MRINSRRSRAGLLILLAMGLGGGVALWRDAGRRWRRVPRWRLQTQWRRIMALRIPAGENPGSASTSSRFRP